jgi:glycosyltransferase involved in cell wall biosynthesis
VKFCVIGPTYPYRGGLAHYTTFLVHHLRCKHEVVFYSYRRQYPRLIFPGNTAPDPSQRALQEHCERTVDTINPLTWWQTARAIVAQRPDVLILQWWTPFWLPLLLVIASAARKASIPILYLCHQFIEPDSGIWEWYLARLALRMSDALIVVSQREYALASQAFPDKLIRLGHHPVYDGFPSQGLSRADARRQLGIDEKVPLALFFGFVRRYKGLRYLIEALAQVSSPVHLLIAGEFWEEEKDYHKLIRRYDLQKRVTVHNRYIPNEEIEVYFTAADVLVLPYLSGSQSGVSMLAWHYGLPIIATNIGGLPETIIQERTGLIVPPADVSALAQAIDRFFDEGLYTPFRSGIIEMRNRFSWTALVRIIEELSDKLVNNPTALNPGHHAL